MRVGADPGAVGLVLGATDSGTEALWMRQDMAGLTRQRGTLPGGRISAEWGYGLDLPWTHGILTPYSGIELAVAAATTCAWAGVMPWGRLASQPGR